MSANNFWNNFSYGFMNGMFNSNPFMCSNMFYPNFNVFDGFRNFWGGGCFSSLFTCPTYMNSMTMYPSFMNANPPINLQSSLPHNTFTFDFNFDDIFKQGNFNINNIIQNNGFKINSTIFDAQLNNEEQFNNSMSDIDFNFGDIFSTESLNAMSQTKNMQSSISKPAKMLGNSVNDKYFDKMLNFILSKEGGYVNDPADSGGETNKGVTQNTYNGYRKSKGLPTRNVREITNEELREIYHNFFVQSGADKIDNPRMALLVFDFAVGSGTNVARKFFKQSGGDLQKFVEIRRNFYQNLVKRRPKDKRFINGWNNRLTSAIAFTKSLPENSLA